jgi:thiamine monophosphate kinase
VNVRMAALAVSLFVTGCGEKSEAVCSSAALEGDFTLIGRPVGDPVAAVAIATAAKVTRNSEATFSAGHRGYEGRARSDGARCFQFVPKSCDVGGGVTMCVTPSLEPIDVTASE